MDGHPHTAAGVQTLGETARRRIASLVMGGAIALAVGAHGAAFAESPAQLPAGADARDQMFQPAMDYDTDGCYPTAAIGPDGTLNGGLKPAGALAGDCRDRSDLDATNMYSRSTCNNGWCAIAYALYFEKDQVLHGIGHRHDWEHVVVWVEKDQVKFVSASRHGDFSTRPSNAALFDRDTHVKIVYHKDGVRSHAFRFGDATDEAPQTATGAWHYPALVGWDFYPPGVRDKLTSAEFGAAIFGLRDGEFSKLLSEAKPDGIAFDPGA